MTDHEEPQHRTYHQPDPDEVDVRQPDDEDGTFGLRLPIVTTGEVRNEDDDPFDREALEGMAEQINEGSVPAFPNHGASPDMAPRYGASRKLGVWRDAAVESRDDGEDQVTATAVLMEPETLPPETGSLRGVLASIKAQAERGVPISTSIGWSEDEDAPGGNDLWEASIVGIPADPRTTEDDVAVAAARDVLADADLEHEQRERLVAEFRAAVMGSDEDEGGDAHETVTDDNTEPEDEQSEGADGEQDSTDDAEEFREFMREQTETQTEILRALSDATRQDDDEDDGDDDDEDEDEDEQSADETETQTVEIDGEERSVEDLVDDHQTALEELRANGVDSDDLDIPDSEDGEGERDAGETDNGPSFSFTEDNE